MSVLEGVYKRQQFGSVGNTSTATAESAAGNNKPVDEKSAGKVNL